MYVCMYVCMLYVCMYVCMCVCTSSTLHVLFLNAVVSIFDVRDSFDIHSSSITKNHCVTVIFMNARFTGVYEHFPVYLQTVLYESA